ncbi:MAG: hypothetical protein O2798_11450 [Chloroflexi bacterium]|nr:hypothetical protein [Chloroflexota bacterium]MDA1241436.1 hypothetical protein [Chloroflexota bacterium]
MRLSGNIANGSIESAPSVGSLGRLAVWFGGVNLGLTALALALPGAEVASGTLRSMALWCGIGG